jgi:hypothetical protein
MEMRHRQLATRAQNLPFVPDVSMRPVECRATISALINLQP